MPAPVRTAAFRPVAAFLKAHATSLLFVALVAALPLITGASL